MPKCVIHPEAYRNFNHSRAKAIAAQCLECSGDSYFERKKCPAKGCALWAFRMGYEVDENDVRVQKRTNPALKADFSPQNDFIDEDDEILDLDEEINSTGK